MTGDGWLADEVEMTLEPGGEARFARGDSVKTGWVEEVRAPERLAFWWAADGEAATRVELTLEPDGDDATTAQGGRDQAARRARPRGDARCTASAGRHSARCSWQPEP